MTLTVGAMMFQFRSLCLASMLALSIGCSGKSDSAGTTGTTGTSEAGDAGGEGSGGDGGGTTHTVTTTDASMDFMPADLTIAVGDTVRFEMSPTHNAIEVSQTVYDARTIERLEGGFAVEYGETADVVFSTAGVHYYICEPHVTIDMIGTITVE
jgi:plastocyanin